MESKIIEQNLSASPTFSERRTGVRKKCFFPIEISLSKTGLWQQGTGTEIGSGGLRFLYDEAIAPTTPLQVRFSLPTLPQPTFFQFTAVALRCQPVVTSSGKCFEIAIKFHMDSIEETFRLSYVLAKSLSME